MKSPKVHSSPYITHEMIDMAAKPLYAKLSL